MKSKRVFIEKMESPLGIEFWCTKSPKNLLNKRKIRKNPFDNSRSLKTREMDSGVTVEEREGKDSINSNLRHPFNLV